MEQFPMNGPQKEDEEEFIMLDLDAVSGQIDIPPNAPYILSGLDTVNPVLVIDNNVKLIGTYEETVGSCFVFSEEEVAPVVHEETGPSEANLFTGKFIIDQSQAQTKKVKHVARLHKILKFKLLVDQENVAKVVQDRPGSGPGVVTAVHNHSWSSCGGEDQTSTDED